MIHFWIILASILPERGAKNMKRIIALLLIMALLLCACGEKQTAQPSSEVSADELAKAIIAYLGQDAAAMENANSIYDAAALEGFVEGYYGLLSEGYTDCAIYRKGGAEAFEISVFRLNESADGENAQECLEEYRRSRQGDFFGYNPEQEAIVEKSLVCVYKGYAAVLICENAQSAVNAFKAAVDGGEYIEVSAKPTDTPQPTPTPTPTPTQEPVSSPTPTPEGTEENSGFKIPSYWSKFIPPGIDDMSLWDNSAVVAAVQARSDEGLNKKDKKLYAATVEILDEIIYEGMSELEMEWAVYSWLTLNAEYDYRHYDIPNAAPRDSYKPHGPIVEGTAVCLGFATAFQLFMDILDIECITVVGAAFGSREDHAWNMVRIDDVWYCVDVTWDLSNGVAMENCCYFNVSSDWMAITDHQWDYKNTPIAIAAEDGSYEVYVPAS